MHRYYWGLGSTSTTALMAALAPDAMSSRKAECRDSSWFLRFIIILCYECFTCMYVRVPCTSLVPTEVRKRALEPLGL